MNVVHTVRPADATELIRSGLRNNVNQLWVGPPGVGKSDIIEAAAEEEGYEVFLSHPVTADPTDYKGLPVRLEDAAGNVTAAFLPFGDLRRLIEADAPLLFFIDDLIQAPPAVQAACMQLLLARRINDHKVSPFVRMMSATNRKEDKAGGNAVLSPVKSRFCILNLQPHQEDWAGWAVKNGIAPVCISFTNFKPEYLTDIKQSPDIENLHCPRTLTKMFQTWMGQDYPKRAEHAYLSGFAGNEVVADFLAFVRIWTELPDIDKALKDPNTLTVPNKPDVRYALAGALAARATVDNASAFYSCVQKLGVDFSIVAVRDALRRDRSLIKAPEFTSWVVENQDIIL